MRKFAKVTLADVLEKVVVTESYSLAETRSRIYRFNFQFLPRSSYTEHFCVSPKHVLRYFETVFVKSFLLGIESEIKAQEKQR